MKREKDKPTETEKEKAWENLLQDIERGKEPENLERLERLVENMEKSK